MAEQYLDTDDDALRSMIHRATGRGDIDTVRRLLDAAPSLVDDRNELNNQPLHEACWAKHLPVVQLLLDRGAAVNARGDFGETPLHFAVRDAGIRSNAIVEALLEAGADVKAVDDRLQQNALGFALREFNDDLAPAIRMLQEKGASIGLEAAMILGDIERVRHILYESTIPLDMSLVRPVADLAASCGQPAIAELINGWLSENDDTGCN